ncbi:hypothetical protein [Cellulomonas sp. URHE0023]|uniref:hypothetical protein n=1 Tax=Cellulomonas sp. URHE0023 TaxID=1380354 RepID=UPI000486F6D3|nr:hypothetical protein [Cellulomonas sp. URHE0023]
MIENRIAGFLAGYCLGDSAARGADDLGRSARAMLASAERLSSSAETREPWHLAPDDAPEVLLAMALPIAAAIAWRPHTPSFLYPRPELTPVNAGWLDYMVNAAVDPSVGSQDLGVIRAVVRNLARRLLEDPDPGLDSLIGWPPHPDVVETMHRALVYGGPLTVDSTPGTVLRTTTDAFDLTRTNPDVPSALASAAGARPAVAALAIGLLGATHGASALPTANLDIATTTSRLARDLVHRGAEPA